MTGGPGPGGPLQGGPGGRSPPGGFIVYRWGQVNTEGGLPPEKIAIRKLALHSETRTGVHSETGRRSIRKPGPVHSETAHATIPKPKTFRSETLTVPIRKP